MQEKISVMYCGTDRSRYPRDGYSDPLRKPDGDTNMYSIVILTSANITKFLKCILKILAFVSLSKSSANIECRDCSYHKYLNILNKINKNNVP